MCLDNSTSPLNIVHSNFSFGGLYINIKVLGALGIQRVNYRLKEFCSPSLYNLPDEQKIQFQSFS